MHHTSASASLHRWAAATALLFAAFLAGCASTPPRAKSTLGAVKCHYSFAYIDRKEEQDRVLKLVTQYAVPGTVAVEPPSSYAAKRSPNGFDVSFQITNLANLNDLHEKLLFPEGASRGGKDSQAFNAHDPELFYAYDSVTLGGQVDMVVNFQVTPGARLLYKPQGQPERDITDRVAADGSVNLATNLHKDETYIYARTIAGNVERFIRINIFTRQVESISRDQYPKDPAK